MRRIDTDELWMNILSFKLKSHHQIILDPISPYYITSIHSHPLSLLFRMTSNETVLIKFHESICKLPRHLKHFLDWSIFWIIMWQSMQIVKELNLLYNGLTFLLINLSKSENYFFGFESVDDSLLIFSDYLLYLLEMLFSVSTSFYSSLNSMFLSDLTFVFA